ncbi:LAETG motif-containing sortase-dependent surface protein [Streptomyces sp. P1-3]|uniref:LAETG motif-containing sortase-dependent surface protein n=1 Tax=Streptomyces sp. P1-3 TaxID=3421658 RepID=UPI003D35A38D
MKLRRALATTAATAAIAPAALLAAPAAHAETPPPAPPPSATGTTAPTAPGPATTAPEPTAPSTEDPGPTPGPTTSAPSAPGPTTSAPGPTDTASTPGPTPTPPGTPPTPPPASSEGPISECGDDEYTEDPDLATTLVDLPSKVVAGSGFHTFAYQVRNASGRSYQRVDYGVVAGTADADHPDGTEEFLTLQFKDPRTGAWTDVAGGYMTFTGVPPHGTVRLDLRLSVSARATEGFGYAITVGAYVDDEGDCVYSTGEYYEFDVLRAGAKTGEVPPARPTPRPQREKRPFPRPRPDGGPAPQGGLAETGTSSPLPTIAVIGGVAMAAGAGTVLTVRRARRTP